MKFCSIVILFVLLIASNIFGSERKVYSTSAEIIQLRRQYNKTPGEFSDIYRLVSENHLTRILYEEGKIESVPTKAIDSPVAILLERFFKKYSLQLITKDGDSLTMVSSHYAIEGNYVVTWGYIFISRGGKSIYVRDEAKDLTKVPFAESSKMICEKLGEQCWVFRRLNDPQALVFPDNPDKN